MKMNNNIRTALLFTIVLLVFTININSQTKWNLTITGGYTLPLADMKGDFPDTLGSAYLNFEKSSTLLTKSGFNIGANAKYCVDTLGKARITGGFMYNSLSGSHDYSGPLGKVSYKNKVNIFTISAGAEYSFMPKKKFNPFIGLELSANFYSGKIEASGDTTFTQNRKSESRFGVTAGTGLNIMISKNIAAVIGVKYSLTNLIGKKTELVTTSVITDDQETGTSSFNELGLNDEENSVNNSKTLYMLQIYTGLSFYFGDIVK